MKKISGINALTGAGHPTTKTATIEVVYTPEKKERVPFTVGDVERYAKDCHRAGMKKSDFIVVMSKLLSAKSVNRCSEIWDKLYTKKASYPYP